MAAVAAEKVLLKLVFTDAASKSMFLGLLALHRIVVKVLSLAKVWSRVEVKWQREPNYALTLNLIDMGRREARRVAWCYKCVHETRAQET